MNTDEIEIIDTTRLSGAFNILDNVQRGNALIAFSDPQLHPPPLTIYWSEKNNESILARLTGNSVRSTFFNPLTGTAYILGDRSTDSDEFDDSVILHEYAHMLAARFSRDDSPGGLHIWVTSSTRALRGRRDGRISFRRPCVGRRSTSTRRGPGLPSVRYDLEEDSPANDRPGYGSEASVDGLLWDLLDENQDDVDTAQFPFASIWARIYGSPQCSVRLLAVFSRIVPREEPGFFRQPACMVIRRGIDFRPGTRAPALRIRFHDPIAVGERS